MRSFDAIIFDLGGTLIYFDGNWPDVLQKADHALYDSLYTAGIRLPKDSFLSQFRRQIDEYYRQRETEFIEYTTLYVLRIILAEWGAGKIVCCDGTASAQPGCTCHGDEGFIQ